MDRGDRRAVVVLGSHGERHVARTSGVDHERVTIEDLEVMQSAGSELFSALWWVVSKHSIHVAFITVSPASIVDWSDSYSSAHADGASSAAMELVNISSASVSDRARP